MRLFLASVFVGASLAASAKGPSCPGGKEPQLSGDAFSPVECSPAQKPVAALPGAGPEPGEASLKELAGRWEASLGTGIGRYEMLLDVKPRWGGKFELVLRLKELQFRDRLTDHLALAPEKASGAYTAELTTDLVPEARLLGRALIGLAPAAASAPPPALAGQAPADAPKELAVREAELSLANGARHRAQWTLEGKDLAVVKVWSAVPGAPLQSFELRLKRTKRDAL